MNKNLYKLIYMINISLSMTIISMEEPQKQIPWGKLPTELKSTILKEVAQGQSMEQILENLKNPTRVSKEFRALAKSLAQNPEEINNIARIYIKNNPKSAYNELFKTIEVGKADIVKALLNGGIDVNSPNEIYGNTPLISAAIFGHTNIIQMLIKAGADVNARNNNGLTALLKSINVHQDNPEVVRLLLDANSDINAQSNHGYTALMFAAMLEYKEIVKLLLSKELKLIYKANEEKQL